MKQVFLLSPAFCGGRRAAIILKPTSELDIAKRLRAGTLTLGEAFSFLSGLYFRGKLAYSSAFGRATGGIAKVLVITAGKGLIPPETPVTIDDLRAFAEVPIDVDEPRYRKPPEPGGMSKEGTP